MSSSNHNNLSKKGKGRQKVKMAKIENETNLQVTFSKRRGGLFKKASELSTLCGSETAVIVFSPGNKAHSFGHPNVEVISNRFLEKNVPPMSDAEKLLDAHRRANIRQHTMKLYQIESELAVEQKRAKELNQVIRKDVINNLDYQQLDMVKGGLLYFKHKLETKVQNATNFLIPEPIPGPGRKDILQWPRSSAPLVLGRSTNPETNVMVSYDPTVANSCLTIPYSSTATSSNLTPHGDS